MKSIFGPFRTFWWYRNFGIINSKNVSSDNRRRHKRTMTKLQWFHYAREQHFFFSKKRRYIQSYVLTICCHWIFFFSHISSSRDSSQLSYTLFTYLLFRLTRITSYCLRKTGGNYLNVSRTKKNYNDNNKNNITIFFNCLAIITETKSKLNNRNNNNITLLSLVSCPCRPWWNKNDTRRVYRAGRERRIDAAGGGGGTVAVRGYFAGRRQFCLVDGTWTRGGRRHSSRRGQFDGIRSVGRAVGHVVRDIRVTAAPTGAARIFFCHSTTARTDGDRIHRGDVGTRHHTDKFTKTRHEDRPTDRPHARNLWYGRMG